MAATIYTTTINETTIARVQDVILEIMMGKNFYIDDVAANKVFVGKPVTQISSEAVNQLPGSGNVPEKALGIRLGAKLEYGHIVIKDIDSASVAADAGLVAGDLIVEVNGRPSKDFDVNALQSYLANKSAQKSAIFLVYARNGNQNQVTLKD